jgi:capsid protein
MVSAAFSIDVGASHAVAQFSDAYDAIKPAGKRKQPPARIVREDNHLQGSKRRQLMSNAADLKRNLSIAAWMVRRHLDYVARMNYAPNTGDRELDKDLKELMIWQSRAENMDRGGRLTREKLFRLAESRRVLDGDMGLIRLRDGRTQCIKGDLLRDPSKKKIPKGQEWESGVRIDEAGLQLAYSIHKRTNGGRGTEFSRIVPRRNFHLYGFFDDAANDQVRGISPFTSAIADLRDTYEAIDYAKVKIKISQLLGVKFTRKEGESLDSALSSDDRGGVDSGDACEEDLEEPRVVDWSKGITTFDMDEGEDVDMVESKNPSTEFQNFIRIVIMVALKSLDIPYSFFDEKHTNFHGSRGSWLQYDRSCVDKRDDQIEMRRQWTTWQKQRWVADGLLLLPSGKTIADLKFDWVPKGFPWWKPSEEVVGSLKAIGGGLDNPFRVCQEADRGDVLENIDRTIQVMKYAHDEGMKHMGEPLRLSFEAEFPQLVQQIMESGDVGE